MPRRKETEDLLLDIATEIFAENGYHGTTITDIHRRAGVGRGTFYGYFPSKEDLFTKVIERALDSVLALLAIQPQIIAQFAAGNIRRRTFDVVGGVIDAAFQDRNLATLVLREAPRAAPEFAASVDEVFARATKHIQSVVEILIQEGVFGPVDPGVFSLMLVGTLKELFAAEALHPSERTTTEVLTALAEIVLDGTAGAPLREQ